MSRNGSYAKMYNTQASLYERIKIRMKNIQLSVRNIVIYSKY